jgi:hypothetical protein
VVINLSQPARQGDAAVFSGRDVAAGDLFKPRRFLADDLFGRSTYGDDLSYTDLLGLERLEGLYRRWLRAKSTNARSATMQLAIREIEPRVAEAWVPRWSYRRDDRARRSFRDTILMILALRQRGLHHLAFADIELTAGPEAAVSDGDAAVRGATPRRCEGRSRAPAAGGGGSRRGGSRRGGGDRGDDSGGDGGSDSGGDGPSGADQGPWGYLAKVALIVSIVAGALAIAASASDLFSASSGSPPVERKVIVKERVIRPKYDRKPGPAPRREENRGGRSRP